MFDVHKPVQGGHINSHEMTQLDDNCEISKLSILVCTLEGERGGHECRRSRVAFILLGIDFEFYIGFRV